MPYDISKHSAAKVTEYTSNTDVVAVLPVIVPTIPLVAIRVLLVSNVWKVRFGPQ